MSAACLLGGAAVLGLAWFGPLAWGAHSFLAHMTAHMAVVAVAAPLLALAVAGGRADPVVHAPAMFAAIPASLVELVVVWGWHAPALHEAARQGAPMLIAEQASFLGAGLYFWLSIVGGNAGRRTSHAGSGVIALVLTFAHMTLLGALLSLAPRALYGHGGAAAALTDQQAGGAVMLVVSAIVYICAGLWIGHRLVRAAEPRTGPA